jgi:hypothetical protein
MGARGNHEFVVTAFEFKGSLHLFVSKRPIPELVVQVVLTILKKKTDRPSIDLVVGRRIIITTAQIDKATDVACKPNVLGHFALRDRRIAM